MAEKIINFRVPDEVEKKLLSDAKQLGLTKSAYLRMLILKGI